MDFSQNHFELFGLPTCFSVDSSSLDQAYRHVQTEIHPDRFAHRPDNEKRMALQWATRANEAYQTLRNPLARGRYLLQLQGVDTAEETNTAMPVDFLMRQMEWREAVADARGGHDIERLEKLSADLRQDSAALHIELGAALDVDQDYDTAAALVRKLRFLEKLEEEIADAIEALLF